MTTIVGVPDILKNQRNQVDQRRLQTELQRVQTEMTTGLRQNRVEATGGDTAQVMGIERSIAEIEARLPLLGVAASRAAASQTALEVVQTGATEAAARMLDDNINSTTDLRGVRGREAETALRQAVASLNTAISNEALFAGAATDGPALRSTDPAFPDAVDKIIDDVRVIIEAAADAATALTDIDAYFAAGGAFETDLVRAEGDFPTVEIDDGARVSYAVRADDEALREMLKGYATAAATAVSTVNADADEALALFDGAAASLISGDNGLTTLRAELGANEERIEKAQVAQQAERATLQLSFNAVMGRDSFEAAAELQQIETQLEALYLITARAAQLSFANYMR